MTMRKSDRNELSTSDIIDRCFHLKLVSDCLEQRGIAGARRFNLKWQKSNKEI